MGIFFAGLIVWCVGGSIFAAILPWLAEALWYVGAFLLLCLKITLRLTGIALWWLATDGRRHAAAGIRAAYLFTRIFWEEWQRPAGETGAEAGNAAPGEDDLFESALTLLGLPRAFTRDELSAAYKKAIRRAHPDAGGSTEMAAAVNAARDLIIARRGWAATVSVA
jgi:hypothetical protein